MASSRPRPFSGWSWSSRRTMALPVSSDLNAPRRVLLLGMLLVAIVGAAGMALHRAARGRMVSAEPPAPASVPRPEVEVRDGRIYQRGFSEPFTGWMTDHHATGELKLRTFVRGGLLDGDSDGWFTNGVQELHERFEAGLPHGPRITWYPNGQKCSEGQLVSGRQEGIYRRWHENGQLAAEAEFAAGKPHGHSRAWYPSGSLKAEAWVTHGEVTNHQVFADGAH